MTTEQRLDRIEGNISSLTEAQRRTQATGGRSLNETASQIPVNKLMPIVTAISDRNWERLKQLELEFTNNHGIETWADVFNFRVLPAFDKEAKTWILVKKCSKGYAVRILAV